MKNTQKEYKIELIGKQVRIINATNPDNNDINGKIIDETRNTIRIKTPNKNIQIIKKNVDFEITEKNNKIKLKGQYLIGKPEDRIKKRLPKKI